MDTNFKKPTLDIYTLTKRNDKTQLLEYIKENQMYPYYMQLTQCNKLDYNENVATALQEKNSATLKALEEDETNNDENFTRDLKISEFYASIMDHKNFTKTSRILMTKNMSTSLKMDVLLCKIRFAILHEDKKVIKSALEEGNDIIAHGCDWDRKNKFKLYEGLCNIILKQFYKAAGCISGSLAAFDCVELFSYEHCVFYLIFCGLLSFNRDELKQKILTCSEVLETLKFNENGIKLVEAIYNCDYANIMMLAMPFFEDVSNDVFVSNLVDYFVREMKIRIYKQLLVSYKSLSLEVFANIMRVGVDFIERDLCDFIVDQRLGCAIDKVAGMVIVNECNDHGDEALLERGESLMRLVKKNVK